MCAPPHLPVTLLTIFSQKIDAFLFRSNGFFQAYADRKALRSMLWKPGHSAMPVGAIFPFSFTFSYHVSMYVNAQIHLRKRAV